MTAWILEYEKLITLAIALRVYCISCGVRCNFNFTDEMFGISNMVFSPQDFGELLGPNFSFFALLCSINCSLGPITVILLIPA